MKHYIILINTILIISNISCFPQQKEVKTGNKSIEKAKTEKIEKVELAENTRGINRHTTFTPNSKILVDNGVTTTYPTTSSEWSNIAREAELIDLSKIADLESPTTERYSDQALSVVITITSNGKIYISGTFDDGRPPKQLEALYKQMTNPKGSPKKKP
ncbi:hypothetical protein [Chryseobacterium herbae]|uniref:Uncharacterized protein n=1 Tax=Chryseobacterium herbae TaxID=2976476 RepID=A0ABT2IRD8_9FLAO|nr:hypothetical protein [Chryseobacterium sp. pc1-10]MCT2561399.1 hypothetical protein [Chryseobacterium sp. pc1-10]